MRNSEREEWMMGNRIQKNGGKKRKKVGK